MTSSSHALRHLVLFKLAEPSEVNVAFVVSSLRPLQRLAVAGMSSFEVGADLVGAERSWDVGVSASFTSRYSLQAYQRHPDHVGAVRAIDHLVAAVASVDFASHRLEVEI